MIFSTVEYFKNAKFAGSLCLNSDQLVRLQSVLFSILQDLDDFCKKKDIKYMLGGGTALGALRHEGFIPWDDDIDVNMTREEFEKFVIGFQEEYQAKYDVQIPGKTKNYHLLLGRIRLKNSILRTREDESASSVGIFIDVFIIENTFDNKLLKHLHGVLCLAGGFVCSCRHFFDKRCFYWQVFSGPKMKTIFLVKTLIGFLTSFLSTDTWFRITNRTYSASTNKKSKYVSIPAGRKHFYGELYDRNRFCNTQNLKFEELLCPVSLDIDNYMRVLYGSDYMKIPPPEKREKHIILDLQFPEDVKRAE